MKRISRSGFTLIEVLVVIAIIAILAGFIFPALQKGMLTAKRNAAVSEARAIAGAIELFYKDYGWMPFHSDRQGFEPPASGSVLGQESSDQQMTETDSKFVIQILMATASETDLKKINPRRKVYLDLDKASEDGELLDPWDRQYLIKMDTDFDGKIQFQSGTKLYNTRAIVMSRGPDREKGEGDNDNAQDDVANVIIDLRNE
jgi:prepilin-type N-terminal cleavage/methylation domain-containing protein